MRISSRLPRRSPPCRQWRTNYTLLYIMHIENLFKIALRAIAANKLRSFLTMLGNNIGVAAVIAMLAIGQGSKASIQANIAQMGSNVIMIRPGQDRGPGGARQSAESMETLKLRDYEALCNESKLLSALDRKSTRLNSSHQD